MGLSIVHTNKTLRKLTNKGLIHWLGRSCEVLDADELAHLAGWEGLGEPVRPLI